jgi:tetratricopeptide (TPR) repeat protein
VEPYCWNEAITTGLAGERQQALFLLPPAAPVQFLLHLAGSYLGARDPEAFLNSARDTADYDDPDRRFLAYRALEQGLYELALYHFSRLEARAPKDFLARGLAHLRAGEPELAEEAIDEALRIRWLNLEFNDLVLQYRLLREIQAVRPLELFDEAYMENLAAQVEPALAGGLAAPLDVAAFCGPPPG